MWIPSTSRSLARTVASVRRTAFLGLVTAVPLAAQPVPSPGIATRDSVAALGAARRAQARFERIRTAGVPIVGFTGSRACEATVGRYCYWHDERATPPAEREPGSVTHARARLLALLDTLAARSPGDRWIAGQRVRYRIDGGDTTGAIRTAAACHAEGWWCLALLGHAHHIARDYGAAAHAFATAMRRMTIAERCAWENPAVLLEPDVRRFMQNHSCDARRAFVERLWWLAAPMLASEDNDLQSEFYARRVASALESNAGRQHPVGWAWDGDALLLRYGWPVWWTRERSVPSSSGAGLSVVGHEASPGFSFFPAARLAMDTLRAAHAGDWHPAPVRPAMRYAPARIRSWTAAHAQVARFVRGDSLLVLAAFDATGDTALESAVARLVVSPGPAARFISPSSAATRGVLEVRLPRSALRSWGLVGVEVVDTVARALSRYRTAIHDLAPGRLTVSDMLVHAPGERTSPVATLREAARLALPSPVAAGGRIGFFWETYGLAAGGEMIDVAITLERINTPWMVRAAVRAGLATRSTPVQVRWRESPELESGAAPRSLTVNVDDLAAGDYRVTLTVRGDDGSAATSIREIVVPR